MNKSTKNNKKNIPVNDEQYGDYLELNSSDSIQNLYDFYELINDKVLIIGKNHIIQNNINKEEFNKNKASRKFKIL